MTWLILLIIPYSAIILLAWCSLLKRSGSPKGDKIPLDNLPFISIIVAAKNEEANLSFLLTDLQELDYPEDKLEIIVVDDNSTDLTPEKIKDAYGVRLLTSKGKGKKHALAMALKKTSGELIITTDADCRIQPGWVRSFAEKYCDDKADLIIGKVETSAGKGPVWFFSTLEFNSLQAVTGGLALAGRPVLCNGANLAFRKASVADYLSAVRADLASGDDIFLLHYLKKSKGKIVWLNNKEGTVSTSFSGRLNSFILQRRRWAGKGLYYKDADTIILALATLAANLSVLTALIIILINSACFLPALLIYAAKSIPEFLLLSGYLENPGKIKTLFLFIPASLLYPLYVLIIALLSPFSHNRW